MKWIVTTQVSGPPLHVHAGSDGRILELPIDAHDVADRISHNAWEMLERHRIESTPDPVVDLFRLAAAVFSADLRIPRRTAFDRWTRQVHLHIQVSDSDLWNGAEQEVRALLRFLSGDHWEVTFHAGAPGRPELHQRRRMFEPLDATSTCLLSGGLDSFIGASDELKAGARLYLVSHNAQGSAAHSNAAQQRVLTALATRYGADHLRHLRFVVSPPPKRVSGGFEPTQRSRSIIFLALGTLVAASLDPPVSLIVPENGYISLNVPLTPSRLGTLSTRTTHPETMRLYRAVLRKVGIPVDVEVPYHFATKGEMLENAKDKPWVIRNARLSLSCAHPTADRHLGPAGLARLHCGYCVPCIVRRAAMHHVGADSAGDYRFDVHGGTLPPGRASDLRAFEIAVERARRQGVSLANVLRAGPLPVDAPAIEGHVGVHRRGIAEIGSFL